MVLIGPILPTVIVFRWREHLKLSGRRVVMPELFKITSAQGAKSSHRILLVQVLVSHTAVNAFLGNFPAWQEQYPEESIREPLSVTLTVSEAEISCLPVWTSPLWEKWDGWLHKVTKDSSGPPPWLLYTSQNRPSWASWRAWLHFAHLSVSRAIIIHPGVKLWICSDIWQVCSNSEIIYNGGSTFESSVTGSCPQECVAVTHR